MSYFVKRADKPKVKKSENLKKSDLDHNALIFKK